MSSADAAQSNVNGPNGTWCTYCTPRKLYHPTDHPADLQRLLIDAPCVVENPWGAQWDGPCTGSWHVHVPCAIAALATLNDGGGSGE